VRVPTGQRVNFRSVAGFSELTLEIASTFPTRLSNGACRCLAIFRPPTILTHTILKNNAGVPAVDLSMHEDDSEEVDVGERSLLEELDVP
jgi:hypothetical protein